MQRSSAARQQPEDLAFFRALDFGVLSVVSISYCAVALLALGAFDARVAVVGGLLLAAAGRYFLPASFNPEQASAGKPVFPMLLLALLAALLFRAEPFLPLHGGQDQGVYVSMSAHLQREGSVFIDDPLPAELPGDRARDVYDARMWRGRARAAQPGIHQSPELGEHVWHWQFYHLHPLWMAIFADLFGDGARFYALTFFSLLSIVGLCLLAYEMTGSRLAALVAGMLLALNPLHVFFSRLHVTEVVALAFSAVGLYYLARAARGVRDGALPASTAALAALSALALSLVFFVRITGFLYLPLLVLVYGLGVWWTARHRPAYTRHVVGYVALVGTLYALSVVYGLHYSPLYSSVVIYEDSFGGLLGAHWRAILAGVVVVTLAALAALPFAVRRQWAPGALAFAARPAVWIGLASLAVALGVGWSLYEAYLVGFTERYADVRRLEPFGVVGAGAPIFWQTGAVGWLLYTSPLLALVAIAGAHRPPFRWPLVLLYFFLAVCLFANLALNIPVIYYHYYYARYLLSEVVPYGIVLAVAATFLADSRWFRALGTAAIVLAVPLHLYFTVRQMPVREGVRPYAVMSRIADRVDDGVLLFDTDGWSADRNENWLTYARLQTPLDHYFGKHVFPVAGSEIDNILGLFDGVSGANVWLLSRRPRDHECLRLADTFAYWDARMVSSATIPVTADQRWWRQQLYLYRRPDVCAAAAPALRLAAGRMYSMGRGQIYAQRLLGPGWHNPEEQHVWSGPAQTLELSRSWFDGERWPAAILLEVRPYAASPDHLVTLTVSSGNTQREIVFDSGATVVHEVGLDCPDDSAACTVQVEVDGARSPREVRGSEDGRTLGVGLYNVGFRFDRQTG